KIFGVLQLKNLVDLGFEEVDTQSHAFQHKLELTKFLKEQCISFFPFIYSIVFKGRVYLSGVLTPCN
ncbi:hypothetical protein Taro_043309, partial [Colocasia esculenta]|nr:hypothetical protein [Colocasia esculenta]